MLRHIFKDAQKQADFEKNGFVIVDFIGDSEIEDLLAYYHSEVKNEISDQGFHVSLDGSDPENVKTISKKIVSVMTRGLAQHFDRCKIFTASYVVKEPGPEFIVPPHQDWSFTQEPEFCSVTVWTPLLDVDANNGGLGVIDGSNGFFHYSRSSPSPQSRSPLTDHLFDLFPYIKVKELKAGQALIFDNRTIHASPPNMSESARIGVGIGVMAEEAPILHYYQNPKSESEELLVYKVDEEFFYQYNNDLLGKNFDGGKVLNGLKLFRTESRVLPELSKEIIDETIRSIPTNAYQHDLVERLKHLYPNHGAEVGLHKEESNLQPKEVIDDRTFFQKYTIPNILAEIRHRIKN